VSAGFSVLLIPDECGRRALDETVADWREERAKAASVLARVAADSRAMAGIARVLAMTTGAGLLRADVWRCFAWTMIAGAVASAAMAFLNTAGLTFAASHLLLLVPGGVVVLSAFAAPFGLGLPRSRRVPGLALCALMFVATAVLAGYIVPRTNEIFRQRVFAQLTDAETRWARPTHLVTGVAEKNVEELLREAMSNGPGAARRALLQRSAWSLSPVALFLLGAAIRAGFSEARAWRLVQLTGGVSALGIFLGSAAACVAIQEALTPPYAGGAPSLPWWTAIVVSLAVTAWLARLRRPSSGAASETPATSSSTAD
jgi:hypothetical protein